MIDEGMDLDFGTNDATIASEPPVVQYCENKIIHSPKNSSIVCQFHEDNIVYHAENDSIANRENTQLNDVRSKNLNKEHYVNRKGEDLADSF